MYVVTANNPRFNILLWGEPGVGKTLLASTAQDHPKMGNVLFLSVEGGLITIAGRGDIRAMNIIGVRKFVPTAEMSVMPENCSTLEDEFWKLANKQGDYADINTVVIDSGTELQTLNLENIVDAAMKAKKNKNRVDEDEIWQEDYGKSNNQLKRLFRWFRDLDINVIITALPVAVFPKGKDGNENVEPIEVRPQFTNKLAKSVMGYMDMVWYLYKDNNKLYLLTQEVGKFKCKTRGVNFAKTIGVQVHIKDINNPQDGGYLLPDLYDIWVESERGGNLNGLQGS